MSSVKRTCDACHRRKITCDGMDPCRNCSSAQLSCAYYHALRVPPQKPNLQGSRAKAIVINELRETASQDTDPALTSSPAHDSSSRLRRSGDPTPPANLYRSSYSAVVESLAPDLPLDIKDENTTDIYIFQRFLGKGRHAVVEKVVHKSDGRIFARKRYIAEGHADAIHIKWQFENEIRIMKTLSEHHHIITYVNDYVQGQVFNLVVLPVADSGSLANYLKGIRNRSYPTFEERDILLQAIGCLASGLAFLHGKNIRHKDIKPENILIHQGKVIFADFGTSLDIVTSTDGIATGCTWKYCAPEAYPKLELPRNRRSDVFSLGCVYCEILSVLEPKFLPHHVLDPLYAENLNLFDNLDPSNLEHSDDFVIKDICVVMLQWDNKRHPDASTVQQYLFQGSTALQSKFATCDVCSRLQSTLTDGDLWGNYLTMQYYLTMQLE